MIWDRSFSPTGSFSTALRVRFGQGLALSIGLALSACGGRAMAHPGGNGDVVAEREDPAALEQESLEQEQELQRILALPAPNCEQACELSGLICDLENRICAIASRHPDDMPTQSRCDSARLRCASGQERVSAASCSCDGG